MAKGAGAKGELSEHDLRVKIIGKFLKEKRTKAGLTQQEVAQGLSYDTAQFVSNWERGISLPPLVALPKLAGMYKVAAKEFIDVMCEYQEQVLKRTKKQMLELFAQHKRA
jgi:transcriptional regulator with XRE-family HTH domain